MAYRVCPECRNPGRIVTKSNSGALDYYRCDRCGHTWVYDKNDPVPEPKPITYMPTKK